MSSPKHFKFCKHGKHKSRCKEYICRYIHNYKVINKYSIDFIIN